jgi:hypothetical protein
LERYTCELKLKIAAFQEERDDIIAMKAQIDSIMAMK